MKSEEEIFMIYLKLLNEERKIKDFTTGPKNKDNSF